MSEQNNGAMQAVAERQLDFKTSVQQDGFFQEASVNSQLVYDVGAHQGEDTEFYLKKGFKVVAVEANPVLAEKLREKFWSNIVDGSLVVVSSAIAETAGEVSFYVNDHSEWGTLQPAFAERNASMGSPSKLIKVRAARFPEVLAAHGVPHYLKIDVEGSDVLCLEGLTETPVRPRYISIESEKRSWQSLLREFELMKKLGYTKFKIVDQEEVYRQRPPHPAAEGRYVEHQFEPGSSGLFGQELPGKWLTMNQAIQRYRLIYLRYYFFGDFGILRQALLRVPGFGKAASSNKSMTRTKPASALRKMLNMLVKVRIFEILFKSHWYDTHATV